MYSPLDFRQPTAIGARVDTPHPQLQAGGGYDNNFVLRGEPGVLRVAARVHGPGMVKRRESWFVDTRGGVRARECSPAVNPTQRFGAALDRAHSSSSKDCSVSSTPSSKSVTFVTISPISGFASRTPTSKGSSMPETSRKSRNCAR